MKKKHQSIGIVTIPISKAGVPPLLNLIDIVYTLFDEVNLITGDIESTFFMKNKKIHTYQVVKNRTFTNTQFTRRAINNIWTQLSISYKLMSITKNVDLWIFFIGGDYLIIPMLIAKLLRKRVVIASAGSGVKSLRFQKDPYTRVVSFLQNINYYLTDGIILYSEKIIEEEGLQKYQNKIYIAHEHFIDFNKFKIKKKFEERNNIVGYIGRLSEEKGVLNFIKAIPEILKRKSNLEFLIVGDGQLRDEIEKYLENENLNDKINLKKWIPHNELPNHMNELKLIVLPSYTEGLPNIMLEAMACSTPVLATSVGAIPDIIKDGETGFIMKNNSIECITENIIRVLNHTDLEKISENGRKLIENEFTFNKAVEGYRKILNTQ